MAVIARGMGAKKRKREGKGTTEGGLSEKERFQTPEGVVRSEVDEEDERLQQQEEVLTQELQVLKDESGRVRMAVSECETEIARMMRQRDEFLQRDVELEDELERKGKKLRLVQQRKVQRKVPPLPKEIYLEVAKHVHENEALAFALACRASRDAMKEVFERRGDNKNKATDKWLTTRATIYDICSFADVWPAPVNGVSVSEDWIKWAFSMKWEHALGLKKDEVDREREAHRDYFLAYQAGRGGFKDLLVWMKSQGCAIHPAACHGAAEGGHLRVLKYSKSEGMSFDSKICNLAALGGHLRVLKYLKSEGMSFDSETCRYAALGGHINVLKYLKSEGVSFDDEITFYCSAGHRNKCLCADWDRRTCYYAARGGHVNILKYLKSEGVPFYPDIFNAAAMGGHVKVLKYLKSEGLPLPFNDDEDEELFYYAARKRKICHDAAGRGHLDMLKYLKSEGMSFDSETCQAAAREGHLDMLNYLKSEGMPFDSATCIAAVRGGHLKVLKYLKSEGVEFASWTCYLAARCGHLKVLKYLKREGVEFDEETCRGAAKEGHIEVLKWLRSEEVNCPWNVSACIWAAEEYEFNDVAKWIKSTICHIC